MTENGGNENAARLLERFQSGEQQAVDQLMPLVYDELRGLAQSLLNFERPDHTLQATALVNEAYLRLLGQSSVDWQSTAHFKAIAAGMIRRILVDHARGKNAAKRGGGNAKITLNDEINLVDSNSDHVDIIALHEALASLESLNDRHASVVELRFFSGMTVDETAHVLGVSPRTVKDDWRFARAWLQVRLCEESR